MRQKASHPPTNDYRYCYVASEYCAIVSVKYSDWRECLETVCIRMYTRRKKQPQISPQLPISLYTCQFIALVFETCKFYNFITSLYLCSRSYIQNLSKDKIESIDNAPLPVFDLPEAKLRGLFSLRPSVKSCRILSPSGSGSRPEVCVSHLVFFRILFILLIQNSL